MALFYFNFYDGRSMSADEIGIEFASAEEAYLQAFATAQAMWSELLGQRVDPAECAFEIVDPAGERLFQLEFAEVREACEGRIMAPPSNNEPGHTFKEIHQRALHAQSELRASFATARESLAEARALLARFHDPVSANDSEADL